MHHRAGEVAAIGAVALAGYAGGLVAGLVATATLEADAGMSLVGLVVQLIAALSSVVAVSLVGHVEQLPTRGAALVTAAVSTILYVALIVLAGHVVWAVSVHAALVVVTVALLLGREVHAWRDRQHRIAETR